jgi:hypothetical protein
MRSYTTSLVLALAAAMLLAGGESTVSARNFSLSSRTFRTTWASLQFMSIDGRTNVRCAVTMEGSFHSSTIAKVVEALVGYVTRAIVKRPCVGGTVWALNGDANEVLGGNVSNTLPWHIKYDGFAGMLPDIRNVNLQIPEEAYLVRDTTFNLLCTYASARRSSGREILYVEWWTNGINWIWRLFVSGTGFKAGRETGCPQLTISGEGRPVAFGTTTELSPRLI